MPPDEWELLEVPNDTCLLARKGKAKIEETNLARLPHAKSVDRGLEGGEFGRQVG